ncbi:Piso0_003518 [Millerozyma farinosa CBS 7064]|uniref:Piso0_003518 protein n=1 Tax=Pichia sorbitophila (strain ATCC MYA-4447 / BCRC 22081 / CBS 7064 / NBRC 10061 / NRRL Y-12695) TaxID=559304 RepID=G8YJA7_PICSO|nr:Piso0_003518 [Millerozyma farinosa CBS 7064]CCE81167.1 Piso0_003518 [Millerozyma farinosa CBS 7064]
MIRQTFYAPAIAAKNAAAVNRRALSASAISRYSVIDSAKEALKKANKKIGEAAAGGIEKTQEMTPNAEKVTEATKETAHKANKKTGEVLAEGLDKAEKLKPELNSEKRRVKENAKGYNDLQDKGSKAETEQNRPDDAF